MKKILLAILTFVYLVVASGIALEIHYCMGKQAGVEWCGSDDGKCGKCGMESKNNGCCQDIHKFIKLTDSHKNTSNEFEAGVKDVLVLAETPSYTSSLNDAVATPAVAYTHPPGPGGHSLCIRNCVFRL